MSINRASNSLLVLYTLSVQSLLNTLLSIECAAAQAGATLSVPAGPTVREVIDNVTNVMAGSITAIAIAAFSVGALLFAMAGGDDSKKSQGKDFMVGACWGVGIVIGAKGILNLVMYFIYGT